MGEPDAVARTKRQRKGLRVRTTRVAVAKPDAQREAAVNGRLRAWPGGKGLAGRMRALTFIRSSTRKMRHASCEMP